MTTGYIAWIQGGASNKDGEIEEETICSRESKRGDGYCLEVYSSGRKGVPCSEQVCYESQKESEGG